MLNPANFFILFLTENKELRNLPQNFIKTTVEWMRSWLLKNDTSAEAILDSSDNYSSKVKLVAQKLTGLLQNEQFVRELNERMATYEQMRSNNATDDHHLDAGDRVPLHKNTIKNSRINVGGNMHVGDNIGNQRNINTSMIHTGSGHNIAGNNNGTNNYYSGGEQQSKVASSGVKRSIRDLVLQGYVEEAITRLVDYSETQAPLIYNDALQLSGRFHSLRHKKNQGTLSLTDATQEHNQINAALIDLLNRIN